MDLCFMMYGGSWKDYTGRRMRVQSLLQSATDMICAGPMPSPGGTGDLRVPAAIPRYNPPGETEGQVPLPRKESDIKTEEDYIPVSNDVILAFQPPLSRFLGAVLSAEPHEVFKSNHLGPDESLFEIRMDLSRRLRRR